jgi:hypothetical protein
LQLPNKTHGYSASFKSFGTEPGLAQAAAKCGQRRPVPL